MSDFDTRLRLEEEIAALHAEIERLRGSLAVCGVIAREGPGAYLPEYECDSIQAVAAVVAKNKRLRAYLPLARAAGRWNMEPPFGQEELQAESEMISKWSDLTPEQRAWLMEDKP